MELYEAINKRRTVREWQNKDVDISAIKRIVDAGLKAPTHNHLREWEFIILHTAEEKTKALQFTKEGVEQFKKDNPIDSWPNKTIEQKMYKYAVPRQYDMLFKAPYIIIPLFKAKSLKAESVDQLNAFASIWCVIENIFLAATAEGLACSMSVPIGKEGNKVCKELGVPADYMMPVYIGIGYPDTNAPDIKQYKYTAEEKIHFGKW
ncbi:MAG: nitroreductase family protein [Elusimicrobiaceae bacterium]|nr:nitroreductase family protein [Elusimicrobiaceae bacterium]